MYNLKISQENQNMVVKEIDLKELFLVMKRRLWIIITTTILFSIVGYILNQATVIPLYQTSTRVIIGADDATRNTLQVIVRDSSILDFVIKKLDLQESAEQLANNISVASVDGSQVVSITVINNDAARAAKIADTTAEVFKEEAPKIYGQATIQILSKAKINTIPINPKTNKKFIFGIVAGIILGIGISYLIDSLDDRIQSKKEIEELLEVPVLGRIPKINKGNLKKLSRTSQLEDK